VRVHQPTSFSPRCFTRWPRTVRRLLAIAAFFASVNFVYAQQRDPAVELYGLTGAYFHGNISLAHEWRPQIGAGILLPVGGNWGVIFDVTTSAVDGRFNIDTGLSPQGDNYAHERRLGLMPAFVRLWRRNRFSVYAGPGLGYEHERQHSRVRPVIARDDAGRPILADVHVDQHSTRTDGVLVIKFGALVSLTDRLVIRSGLSWLPRYIDEDPSASFEAGIGYRF
jgi:hypothetical protein